MNLRCQNYENIEAPRIKQYWNVVSNNLRTLVNALKKHIVHTHKYLRTAWLGLWTLQPKQELQTPDV